MDPRTRLLRGYSASILVLNVGAAVVAVVLNLPSQFGQVGTDAGSDVWTVGTAISAPAAPAVLLLAVLALAGRPGRWGRVGLGAAYLAAVLVGIGGAGEIAAEPTRDVSRTVLVAAGLSWLAASVGLVALTTWVLLRRSPRGLPARPSPGLDHVR